jgi:hypothetical protein
MTVAKVGRRAVDDRPWRRASLATIIAAVTGNHHEAGTADITILHSGAETRRALPRWPTCAVGPRRIDDGVAGHTRKTARPDGAYWM